MKSFDHIQFNKSKLFLHLSKQSSLFSAFVIIIIVIITHCLESKEIPGVEF